jgi:hypothetical protein
VTERRGRRYKQLLDCIKNKRGYWKLKQEILDGFVWVTGYGTFVREIAEWMILLQKYCALYLQSELHISVYDAVISHNETLPVGLWKGGTTHSDTNWQQGPIHFFVKKNNLMHYLSSVNFVTQPLHVSGMFIAHHQEVFTVYIQQLVRSILTQPAASQLKRITRTNCCTYTVNTSWWWAISLPKTCRG